jgi:hypothetical protein
VAEEEEQQAAEERDLSLLSSDSATRASIAAATQDATAEGWCACCCCFFGRGKKKGLGGERKGMNKENKRARREALCGASGEENVPKERTKQPLFVPLSPPLSLPNCDLTSSGISSAAAMLSMSSLEAAGRDPPGRIVPPKTPAKGDAVPDVGGVGNAPRSAAAATAAAAALSNAPSQQGELLVIPLLLRDGCGGERAQECGGKEVVIAMTAPSSKS